MYFRNTGHGREEIAKAIYEQISNLSANVYASVTPAAVELATEIANLTPGDLSRTFFCQGGSEANESALKLAQAYHMRMGEKGRYKVISRRGVVSRLDVWDDVARRAPRLPAHRLPTQAFERGTRSRSALLPLRIQLHDARAVRGACRVGDREGHHQRRSRLDIGRDRGAGYAAVGWSRAARKLLANGQRDLRPLRRHPHLRRGHHRLRTSRRMVRRRGRQHPARHHLLRQRHHQRILPPRRLHRRPPHRRRLRRRDPKRPGATCTPTLLIPAE